MRTFRLILTVVFATVLPLATPAKNIPGATNVRPTGLVVTQGGSLLLACEVTRETKDVILFSATSHDSEWLAVYTLERASDAVLWRGAQGEIRLFYTQDGFLMSRVCMQPDVDSRQWGAASVITRGHCCSPPVFLRNGALALSAYLEEDDSPGILVSMDRGSSWFTQPGRIHLEEKIHCRRPCPVLMPHRSGALSIYNGATGYQWKWRSVSRDFGRSWSLPQRYIYSPDQPLSMCVLRSGKWLLAKNGYLDQMLFYMPDKLVAYLSEDEGNTWFGNLVIDERMDCSSPCVTDAGDGSLYIAYAYHPFMAGKSEVYLARTSEIEINQAAAEEIAKVEDRRLILSCEDAVRLQKVETEKYASTKRKPDGEALVVATYNIEYENPGARYPWKKRLAYVKDLFDTHRFDVVGVQEPWRPEYLQLKEALQKDYSSIWACTNLDRDDFSNAIFYRRDRVELLEHDIFWYTENPGMKNGFGGTTSRLCIWGKFRDRKSGRVFFLFNSHFDFSNYETQLVSARLLARKVREIAGDCPAICTGDFNSTDENAACVFLSGGPFLKDSRTEAKRVINSKMSTSGLYRKPEDIPNNGYRIDHIYFTPGLSRIDSWEVLAEEHVGIWGGSDHNPIKVQWQILK